MEPSLVQLNTTDLPEVEMRAQRSKSRHWAMRSGPRRLVPAVSNQWCARSELLVSIPEQDIVDEVIEQEILTGESDGPYHLDDDGSHDDVDGPWDHDDTRIIGPSALGMCPRPTLEFGEILAASGSPSQKRARRQQQVLSASWIVPATSGKSGKKSTAKDKTEKHDENEGEWPTLRRPGAAAAAAHSTALSFLLPSLSDRQKEEGDSEVSSECCASESWEVCSNVSSMASSWAVLEGEQWLKDVEETKSSSWADVLKEVGLRGKDDAEGQVVAAAAVGAATEAASAAANLPGGSTTPAAPVSFAEAVRRGGDGGSGSTTIVEGGKDTTTKKTEDNDVQQKKKKATPAVAKEETLVVHEADDVEFYDIYDDADDWDAFVSTTPQYAAPAEKDNRGGGGRTKATKGPRSVKQQERVAAARDRRTVQRAKDRGMAKDRGIAKMAM